MIQERIDEIVQAHYADQIQKASKNGDVLNCLLFKKVDGDIREYKGIVFPINGLPFETDKEIRAVFDDVISTYPDWFYS